MELARDPALGGFYAVAVGVIGVLGLQAAIDPGALELVAEVVVEGFFGGQCAFGDDFFAAVADRVEDVGGEAAGALGLDQAVGVS